MALIDFTGGPSTPSNTPPDATPPIGGGIPFGGMPMMMMAGPDDDPTDLLINYNEEFKNASPILFRDAVIQQTCAVLIGKNKPNALLVGPAGAGKTRIVEDLARRIANTDSTIPDSLIGATIYELPLSNLVAGSGIVGQLEEKVQSVVGFAENPDNHAIIFIDEIHMLIQGHGPYAQVAQILKPALARGHMRTIGATTNQEATDLTNDPAFNRRFSRVIVDELTREQTTEILSSMWGDMAKHYNNEVIINNNETFALIASIADQYATASQHRPDGAITLMDRACAEAIVNRKVNSQSLDPTMRQMLLSTPITLNERKVRECAKKLATGQSKQVTINDASLDARFATIFGQDQIIERVRKLMKLTELNLFPRTRPLTVLCAGPSGCGKSEIAKIVASELTGCPPITLNMTEYNSPASVNRIIGSPAGYVGSDSHAELPFDSLESNPYQVILLDEMEKCDKSVQRLFMSAFDDGYIKTSKGKTVDFSKCVIFVTTNASHSAGATKAAGFTAAATKSDSDNVNDLSNWFDVEFLNRFSTILTFNPISKETYRDILADKYRRYVTSIKQDHPSLKLEDELDDKTLTEMTDRTYIPDFGARPADRHIREYIEDMALNTP